MALPLGGCVTLVRLRDLSVLCNQSSSPAPQLFFLVESWGDDEAGGGAARQPLPLAKQKEKQRMGLLCSSIYGILWGYPRADRDLVRHRSRRSLENGILCLGP